MRDFLVQYVLEIYNMDFISERKTTTKTTKQQQKQQQQQQQQQQL